ncbi:MAG: CsgG/HfaB family protein [Desulfobacteraceae bacterium]|nr:CsgG/HfaB family protein [Desulfobacteraceae bacterium]
MNKKFKFLFLLIVFTFVFITTGFCTPRVAIMDFDNRTPYGSYQLGTGASDILTTELVKLNKFDMYERDRLNSIVSEQDLGASGRVDAATAAKIGKIAGVNYIITGAVTEYGKTKGGGGGHGVSLGRIGYHATVDVRMVNAVTGKIVFADSGSASSSSTKVSVFGFGGGQSFNEKAATETMRQAIQQLAEKISTLNLAGSGKVSTGGSGNTKAILIADVDGNTITLNKGTELGLIEGTVLTVKRKGKVIKDPATGKVLKIKYKTVGKIKVTESEKGYSECIIISGSGFKVGDIVK